MSEMTWEQKLAALNAIVEHQLVMRKPGDWYVTGRLEVAGDGFLTSPTQSGKTPQEAVEQCWKQYVDDLSHEEYLFGGIPGDTKAVKWNGFMWQDASHMRKRSATQSQS